jgi:hypothetical protein
MEIVTGHKFGLVRFAISVHLDGLGALNMYWSHWGSVIYGNASSQLFRPEIVQS